MNGTYVLTQSIGKDGKTIRAKNAPKRIKGDRFCHDCGKKLSSYNKDSRCFQCNGKVDSMDKTDNVLKYLKENKEKFVKKGFLR